ncbi:ferritin-like domain-containing protein [Streptomyces sp. 2A115]|uniref:ferritin-like domain-containing protein n=1 Tax=Streptomyces sp. 2A115 TaxID=3457439 RepID=UPI003FD1D816
MSDPVPGAAGPPVPGGKIFPRNLTARADHVVRGNSAGTRPESGVDNCYPGLEFDQRNLDRAFFPGLAVDFHRPDGAQVLAVTGGPGAERGLNEADLPLHVWAICGRTTVDEPENRARTFSCTGLNGLEVWRRVHDLLPGRVAVLLGPAPGRLSPGADIVGGDLNGLRVTGRSIVQRDQNGAVEAAVLIADRARYLDEDGVIEPEVYQPGDLTRSLCAPWQFDFRDCGCFYWAASKPDIATSSDGQFRDLNFQRRDRTTVPPELDGPTGAGRRERELDYAELITDWNVLPVVLNGREDDSLGAPPVPEVKPLTREEVVAELEYLATVEHALCVEYLFAHYSLNAPMRLPDDASPLTRRIFAAAEEVFSVAVDEMRHLRWVNEALGALGRPPRLGRATRIHRDLDHLFELRPLSPEQLDWFIDVERPSQQAGTGVDGMYVRLHQTLTGNPDEFPEHDRLAHLIKLVIDEGQDHFRRFTAVKGHLEGLSPDQYLRPMGDGSDDPLAAQLLALSDQNYAVLLGTLGATFALGDQAGGVLIEQSRRTMFNLHEVNHVLAARGVAPSFTLPAPLVAPAAEGGERADGQAAARAAAEAATSIRTEISSLGDQAERAMMLRQQADMDLLLAALNPNGAGADHVTSPSGGDRP